MGNEGRNPPRGGELHSNIKTMVCREIENPWPRLRQINGNINNRVVIQTNWKSCVFERNTQNQSFTV